MYNINSYIGIGNIRLGMTSKEIEKLMNSIPTRFKKDLEDKFLSDDYGDFFVYYNDFGVCDAIEFKYTTKIPLTYRDKDLFKFNYCDLKKFLKQFTDDLNEDDCGFISFKLGIGCYAPEMDENPECLVEGIIVFEEGYYD